MTKINKAKLKFKLAYRYIRILEIDNLLELEKLQSLKVLNYYLNHALISYKNRDKCNKFDCLKFIRNIIRKR